jgi:hypothetical protein
MLHAALICTGLLAALAGDSSPSPRDLKTYDALKLKAGKDPQAQVKLALWCEAHGLDAERLKHLAQAVLADPGNVTARGLLGLLGFGGRWESPEKVAERVRADEERGARLAEYNGRRDRLEDKERALRAAVERLKVKGRPEDAYAAQLKANRELAQAHAGLGIWCDRNGLKPEAMAHFTTAVHLDPSRESSWRHLGYVKRDGRWISPEQAAAEAKDDRDRRQANRHWEPLLRKWKSWLGGSAARREEAEGLLADVTNPRAVPAILKVFPIGGTEADQSRMLGMLERIDDPRSSRGLADLALRAGTPSLRMAAIEVLKKRPRRDYAAQLVESIRGKIDYAVQPVASPGSTGALILDTHRVRMIRTYDTPPVFLPASSFRGYVGYDANGLPVIAQGRELDQMNRDQNPFSVAMKVREIEARTAALIAAANVKAQFVQQRIVDDVNQVEMLNRQAEADNAQIIPVLQLAAGAPKDLKDDEESWHVWWYDTLGYSYKSPSKVTFVEDVSPSQYPPPTITTCFVAGTPVRTLDGPRPIESIRVGDQVLSQDAATGALGFQPVVFVHHNPPNKTLRVSLSSGDSVACSVYHRFWRANLGWAMAREIKPGDVLRSLGGRVQVTGVEPDTSQPLYNLDVARTRTFFAGANHLLVHDNTLPDDRLRPFDALPVVEVGRPE